MKLVAFSVTNYRSITTAHKISLSNLTVLVGKNNEGKSNILNALNIAMSAILINSRIPLTNMTYNRRFLPRRINFDWSRDFPVQLQNRKSGLESIFGLNFRLESSELEIFQTETGIHGNEDIPIRIKIGKDNRPKIEIPKKGSPAYNKKSEKITEFISSRISFNYIGAVRTENMAMSALKEIINEELSSLTSNQEYIEAIKKISNLQQEALNKIADTLKSPLKVFLPELKSVKIIKDSYDLIIRGLGSDIDIIIDDGVSTSISYKGEGIKSLATLAILKERRTTKAASVIAIEEPESHLHSGAIHSLLEVISKISENNQVIISTHNPLFVQRNDIKSNIIVNNGLAYQAKSVSEVREILGVLVSDNLKNASNVLVVEGEDDERALLKILPLKSSKIATALKNNSLVIQPLNGASNLSYSLTDLKKNMCKYVVLLDNDEAGKAAADIAIKCGLLNLNEIRYTICNGSPEAEFEDCLNPTIYKDVIFNNYGVKLDCSEFRSNKKWSDRLKACFLSQGSNWTDTIEKKVKFDVVEAIPNDLAAALIPQKSGFIDGLVNLIELMI